jgi:glycosyltransferase involved in cell wall biosynthesis
MPYCSYYKKDRLKKKKILALTNYKPDKQYSMLKFAELLLFHCGDSVDIEISEIYPLPVFGKFIKYSYLKKWFSYIDKYIIFPVRLRHNLVTKFQDIDIIHITDHSNSPYFRTIKKLSSAKKLITVHDLIAIRSALGDFTSAPKVSLSGKILQNWIRKSLSCADFFACDSGQTKEQLCKIFSESKECSSVIHLGTNFKKKDQLLNKKHSFASLDLHDDTFILNVGSAAWYKNRLAVFRSFVSLRKSSCWSNLKLVLVGPPPQDHEMDSEIANWIKTNPESIVVISDTTEDALHLLYANAEVLLAPSFVEGFGWPPLEAANLGCPVISSKTGAISDLLQENAIYVNPEQQESINIALTKALKKNLPKMKKISLPSNQDCRRKYFELYHKLTQI